MNEDSTTGAISDRATIYSLIQPLSGRSVDLLVPGSLANCHAPDLGSAPFDSQPQPSSSTLAFIERLCAAVVAHDAEIFPSARRRAGDHRGIVAWRWRDAFRRAGAEAPTVRADVSTGVLLAQHRHLAGRATQLRDGPAWVDHSARYGRFVYFAPAESLPAMVADFESWLRRSPQSLETAAIVLDQVLHMHAFDDGNGRVARALAWRHVGFGWSSRLALAMALCTARCHESTWLPRTSAFLQRDWHAYRMWWHRWLNAGATLVTNMQEIVARFVSAAESAIGRPGANTARLTRALLHRGAVGAQRLSADLSISTKNASRLVQALEAAALLTPVGDDEWIAEALLAETADALEDVVTAPA